MKQNVIIAGAGISAASPSNVPSWWEYNKKLIEQIKTEALKLCPEAANILECIDAKNKLPVQCISQLVVSQGAGKSYFPLLELLNGTVPNANHFGLVELARKGLLKAIVTTNFDTLIETAFRSEAAPLFTIVQKKDYYESAQVNHCKLFKIHGSVHDDASMIDTVSQKAVGLSPEKRFILENLFANSNIFVIGFSGADLDFDLDYIPLVQAIESGSKLTWIIRPGSAPNHNVEKLQRLYPQKVSVRNMELHEFFEDFGVQYREDQKTNSNISVTENEENLSIRIEELFSSAPIGPHGCVGYCLTLLDMIGADEGAKELARMYEQKINWSALNVLSVLGINALARQKLINGDWQGAIRGYQTVIQCCQHLNTLNCEAQKKFDGLISLDQKREQKLEYAQNLVAAYINLGNTYYYMAFAEGADTLDNAKKYFELAQSQLQQNPSISCQSLVSFGLARVEYLLDKNYDRYLDALHISKEYAQQEGRLDTFAELLLEECKIRMEIGEYYWAKNSLDLSQDALKNVGRIALNKQWEKLNNEYQIRKGKQAELVTNKTLQILMSRVDDSERKWIILCEAKQETKNLAPLFYQLCIKYIKQGKWQRLGDVAQCCYAVACTDSHRADALYALGCAATEQAKYTEAEKYFGQIVDMGKGINDMKLGWSRSELARLYVRKGDVSRAMSHFNKCIQVLQELGDLEQLTQAVSGIIAELFRCGQLEQAENGAAQLLEVLDDSNAANFKKYLEFLHREYGHNTGTDIRAQPPHIIATEALRLFDTGDRIQARTLMQLAADKYRETGNLDGVGKCENNIGVWCLAEKDYEEAIAHFKTAIAIKFSQKDVGGVINHLALLLQIYAVSLGDLEKAEKVACYAEQNMILYADNAEKYLLYYGLAFYKLRTGDYALTLDYCKKAREGLPYLLNVYPDCEEKLQSIINLLEEAFSCQPLSVEWSEFDLNVLEAARLGKIGQLEECLAMVDKLKMTYGEDKIKNGILEGTYANALLWAGKYVQAIEFYRLALKNFETVVDGDRRIVASQRLTAINGITIALGYLGREGEAIELLRKELKQAEMQFSNRCSLTVSLCNRLITLHKDTLKRDDGIFTEVCELLDSLAVSGELTHEEHGILYCVYGMLYMVIGDNAEAKRYYQQAKNEFLIVNSRHLIVVEQIMKNILC